VISSPTLEVTCVSVGADVFVLEGEVVGVELSGSGESVEFIVGKRVASGIIAVAEGMGVKIALGMSVAFGGVAVPISSAVLQPTRNDRIMNKWRVRCFLATIPINPLQGEKSLPKSRSIDCTCSSTLSK